MKNPLIYQIIEKKSAEFIKPPWLISKATVSNQGGGGRVIFILYNIIYNI
jgi:hypothetical protein